MLPGRCLLILILCLCLSACSASRLVVVADVHGDIDAVVSILVAARVIQARGDPRRLGAEESLMSLLHSKATNRAWFERLLATTVWTAAPGTIVVQLGDQVDSGPYASEVVLFFDHLTDLARGKGSRVVALLGNHDVLWIMNNKSDAFPASQLSAVGAMPSRGPAQIAVRKALSRRPVVARVGDVLVSHAGVNVATMAWLSKHSSSTDTISRMTAAMDFCAGDRACGYLNAVSRITLDDLSARAASRHVQPEFTAPLSMLWNRDVVLSGLREHCDGEVDPGLLEWNKLATSKRVRDDETASPTPVARQVIGHTPLPESRMRNLCGGRLLALDTCMTSYRPGGSTNPVVTSARMPCGVSRGWVELVVDDATGASSSVEFHYV